MVYVCVWLCVYGCMQRPSRCKPKLNPPNPNPMQGFDTVSRETSAGPSVFTSGLVKIGVGLAHHQFGSRMESTTWKDLVRLPSFFGVVSVFVLFGAIALVVLPL